MRGANDAPARELLLSPPTCATSQAVAARAASSAQAAAAPALHERKDCPECMHDAIDSSAELARADYASLRCGARAVGGVVLG